MPTSRGEGPQRVAPGPSPPQVLVAGGGIAGLAAATILAERGVGVTVVEAEGFLGGRAGAWEERLSSGERFSMERGFHAFFRQYYNLRALLRRFDPQLRVLRPLEDYPLLGPEGRIESFAGLPRRTPWNLISLVRRTPSLGFSDVLRVDKRAALQMLAFDPEKTYARFDDVSAATFLDSLRFPGRARQMLFEVFAHSFFNPEAEMSAAELLMMFHFYFTGNPEGLVFDVAREPFDAALFLPWRSYLERRGVRFELGERVRRAVPDGGGWRLECDTRRALRAEALVLALPVGPMRTLVEASPALGSSGWRTEIARLQPTWPFAVLRLWLDRPTAPGRHPFVGTAGLGLLDNISLYHLFEGESARWAARNGGAVVELHAYGVPPGTPEDEVRVELVARLHALYPETRGARVLEERYLWRADCPAFGLGSNRHRPTVETPDERVVLAGDFVRLPFASALMERAAASGITAANRLLGRWRVRPEPIWSVGDGPLRRFQNLL